MNNFQINLDPLSTILSKSDILYISIYTLFGNSITSKIICVIVGFTTATFLLLKMLCLVLC